MICFKRKAVFVHIPKTAGTTIEKCFAGVDDFSHNKLPDEFVRTNLQTSGRHSTLPILLKHLNSLNEDISKYTFFTVIRNPWTRNLSAAIYHQKKRELPLRFDIKILQSQGVWGKGFDHYVPYNLINKMDYILRFENLASEFRDMCVDQKWLDIKDTVATSHANVSGSKKFKVTDWYDSNMINFVARNNKAELTKFGYKFNK